MSSKSNVTKKNNNNIVIEEDVATATVPGPENFDEFLPWVCAQLSVGATVVVKRTVLNQTVNYNTLSQNLKTKRGKKLPSLPKESSESSIKALPTKSVAVFSVAWDEDNVLVETVYDTSFNLIKIKFYNNKCIPREVLQIIGMVTQFHPHLDTISINSGLIIETVYEISKFLPRSNVTEVCLDYTYLKKANYYILLDNACLKHLSLAKCKLNDDVVEFIAQRLTSPQPASKKLSALNLSTNHITDIGAKHIADMLKTNRQLSYLNLADNRITDEGVKFILDTLKYFALDKKELYDSRKRHYDYLQKKIATVQRVAIEMKNAVTRRSSAVKRRKTMKRQKTQEVVPSTMSLNNLEKVDAATYEKAENFVARTYEPFLDPFSPENTESQDGVTYCVGNNALQYLNISYNNLTHLSLKPLLEVLVTQQHLNRKPRGLVNIRIDGNFLPRTCEELLKIDDILGFNLSLVRPPGYRASEPAVRKRGTARLS